MQTLVSQIGCKSPHTASYLGNKPRRPFRIKIAATNQVYIVVVRIKTPRVLRMTQIM